MTATVTRAGSEYVAIPTARCALAAVVTVMVAAVLVCAGMILTAPGLGADAAATAKMARASASAA